MAIGGIGAPIGTPIGAVLDSVTLVPGTQRIIYARAESRVLIARE